MRKDLKIGMAIGAVLLVLLIVYLAVPKSADTDVAQDAGLTEGQPADGEQAPADGSADPAGNDAVPGDAGSTGAQVAGGTDQPRQAPAGEGRDPFARNADGSDSQSTASAGEGTNWAKLLETGEMPLRTMTPSLSASKTEPPAAGGTPAAPSDALAQAASDVTSGSASAAAPTTTNSDAEPSGTSAKSSDATSNRATPAGGARTHRVAKGETFAKIAETLLGDERYYLEIEKANPDIDPTRIRPGMVINLPDVSALKRSTGSSSSDDAAVTASGRQQRELDPEKEYKVRPGDSLYIIAKRIYHNSAKSDEIYELNKGVIGDDPAKVKAGMILKLPPKGESETSESR